MLRHRFMTLMAMLGTIVLTGYLYVLIPKGFFPQQDTGLIIGQSEAAQDISYSAMRRTPASLDRSRAARTQRSLQLDRRSAPAAAIPRSTPAAYSLRSNRIISAPASTKSSQRLRTDSPSIQGITLYMQAAQDITIGGRVSKTQYQYTLDDADPGELNHWAALFLDKIKTLPGDH